MENSKIIMVHGIGNNEPGWLDVEWAAKLMGVDKDRIVPFSYEKIFDEDRKRRIVEQILKAACTAALAYYAPSAAPAAAPALSKAEDYLGDIVSYFANKTIRHAIQKDLQLTIQRHSARYVVGHSLGSIVAYEALKTKAQSPDCTLITVGCPIGSPALSRLLPQFLEGTEQPDRAFKNWFNVHGSLDLLGGPIKMDCTRNFSIQGDHSLQDYLPATGQIING